MSNPWTAFASLLPKKTKWIGQVVSISEGKAVLSIPQGLGGSSVPDVVVDISNGYDVDDYVFVEAGIVIAKAPPLRSAFRETIF